MNVKVDRPFTELDGTTIKEGGKEVTLKIAAIRALLSPQEKISEEEKIKRFNLSRRVYAGGEIDLTTDECALIKKCIHAVFDSPLIYAEADEMIENKVVHPGAVKE